MRSTMVNPCLTMILAALLGACGEGRDVGATAGGGPTGDDAGNTAAARERPSVRVAPLPADQCGWLPVSEVEATVGKLAEAPRPERDGCRYTLVIPDDVAAQRQEAIDRMDKLRELLKDPSLGDYKGPMANYHRDPATYAVTLSVDLSGAVAAELAAAAVNAHELESLLPGQQPESQDSTETPGDEGWDAQPLAMYGFSGRIGHVQISVLGQAPDVPRATAKALADRVRDRLPDLPFEDVSAYQVMVPGPEPMDPCSLLTRAEVEAVLGQLVVEPYRASSQHPALALGNGYGCSFYTAGHHVFSIVPIWRGGQQEYNLHKGMGAFVSQVLPQELLVLKGPWDEAYVSGATGALLLLKGDRLLEVHYKTSSTDIRGAVRLAAQAIRQL